MQSIIYSAFKDNLSEFDAVTGEFNRLVRDCQIPIASNPLKVRSYFAGATHEQQQVFLDKIRLYSGLIKLSVVERIDVLRDKKFLWHAFKKINLCPSSDLLEKISPDECIEVYDHNGIQIFSNFQFFTLTSYTFEEMIWFPWDELFERDGAHTDALMNEFIRCFTTATAPFKPDIEDHLCWEVMSEQKKRALVKMQMFAPVFGANQKTRAMVATSKIQLII